MWDRHQILLIIWSKLSKLINFESYRINLLDIRSEMWWQSLIFQWFSQEFRKLCNPLMPRLSPDHSNPHTRSCWVQNIFLSLILQKLLWGTIFPSFPDILRKYRKGKKGPHNIFEALQCFETILEPGFLPGKKAGKDGYGLTLPEKIQCSHNDSKDQ